MKNSGIVGEDDEGRTLRMRKVNIPTSVFKSAVRRYSQQLQHLHIFRTHPQSVPNMNKHLDEIT
jgi:hypothetical protein